MIKNILFSFVVFVFPVFVYALSVPDFMIGRFFDADGSLYELTKDKIFFGDAFLSEQFVVSENHVVEIGFESYKIDFVNRGFFSLVFANIDNELYVYFIKHINKEEAEVISVIILIPEDEYLDIINKQNEI